MSQGIFLVGFEFLRRNPLPFPPPLPLKRYCGCGGISMHRGGAGDILLLTLDKCYHVVRGMLNMKWTSCTTKPLAEENQCIKTTKNWKALFCSSLQAGWLAGWASIFFLILFTAKAIPGRILNNRDWTIHHPYFLRSTSWFCRCRCCCSQTRGQTASTLFVLNHLLCSLRIQNLWQTTDQSSGPNARWMIKFLL